MKKIIIYLFLGITIVFGREIYVFDVFGIPGLKYNHIAILIVLATYWRALLNSKTPELKFIWGLVFLSLISSYLGYRANNVGVFFNLNYIFGILFFIVGYHSTQSINNYEKLLTLFTILFFITYLFKELQFTLGGTPLLFGFDEIRTTRNFSGDHLIKGSSDSICTIGAVILLNYLTLKRRFRFLVLFITLWILLRYGVRTPIFAAAIAYFSWVLFAGRLSSSSILLPLAGFIGTLLFVFDVNIYFYKFIEVIRVNDLDTRETFIWRVAMWLDTLSTVFNSGFYLIGTSGMEIEFNLINSLGFREYLNPHNSYIYILLNFGILNVLLMLILIIKCLKVERGKFYNRLFAASYCSVLMYAIYANGSSVHEIIYQAPLFWFLLGVHRKLSMFAYDRPKHMIAA